MSFIFRRPFANKKILDTVERLDECDQTNLIRTMSSVIMNLDSYKRARPPPEKKVCSSSIQSLRENVRNGDDQRKEPQSPMYIILYNRLSLGLVSK